MPELPESQCTLWMQFSCAYPALLRWTIADYHRMIAVGLLGDRSTFSPKLYRHKTNHDAQCPPITKIQRYLVEQRHPQFLMSAKPFWNLGYELQGLHHDRTQ